MASVHFLYLQSERAGDQYIGSIVAGLPLQSELFDALSPYLASLSKSVENAMWGGRSRSGIRSAFPTQYKISSLRAVSQMLLTSLV